MVEHPAGIGTVSASAEPVQRWKARWKENWNALKASAPGKRFQDAYRRQKERDRTRSKLARWARPLLAVLSFAIGVVLAFIPGPAVVFFALSAALFASLSLPIARALDRTEVWLRRQWSVLRGRRSGWT